MWLNVVGALSGPNNTPCRLTVTDDDIIEKSNLSRQFLFRNHNVGKSKSLSAAEVNTSVLCVGVSVIV